MEQISVKLKEVYELLIAEHTKTGQKKYKRLAKAIMLVMIIHNII